MRSYLAPDLIIASVLRMNTKLTRYILSLLEDPERRFITGDYVELETLTALRYKKQKERLEFARMFFCKSEYVNSTNRILVRATDLASNYGLSAMESLHAASALYAGADDLLTLEKPGKTLFRIPPYVLKIVSLHEEYS